MSYELRIIRRLLEIGTSSKHSLDANVSSDGHISLRIKKPRASEYEDLPLDQFLAMVMAGAEQQTTSQ